MKIDTLIQYLKLDPELLKKLNKLPTGSENSENNPDSSQKETATVISKTLSDILPLTEKLDLALQKQIIKTWLQVNLPFAKTQIKKLVQYLQNNNYEQSTSTTGNFHHPTINLKPELLIKSFAFLLKYNLPVTPQLLAGVAANLDTASNSVETLSTNYDINSTNTASQENSGILDDSTKTNLTTKINSNIPRELATVIKNRLVLTLNNSPSQIQEQLQQYSEQLHEVIQLLQNSNKPDAAGLLNHLLGQQTLNLQQSLPDNNQLLLALEIPVILAENEKTIPLYLQVWQEESDKNSDSNNKNTKTNASKNIFKVNFIIELNQLGIIRADIKIDKKKIMSQFKTTSTNTQKLIEQSFPLLQKKLEELGYEVIDPVLEQLKNNNINNSESGSPFPEPIIPFDKNAKKIEELIHIDFKI